MRRGRRRSAPSAARAEVSSRVASVVRLGLAPALVYLAAFTLLTWPLAVSFTTHFFADAGDGLQNVWNIWWVDKALREGRSPWWTDQLHFPYGTTLLAHTLNPFNGVLGLGLLRVLTLVEAHNVIVLFGFVVGGLGAFLLARYLTGDYAGSLLAGALFTFSSFHFAHAHGHLQLVSLEWIPLFLLAWHRLLAGPSRGRGVGAGLALFLVLLCDYYYFFYCAVAAVLLAGWHAWSGADAAFLFRRDRRPALGAFLLTCAATSLPLAGALLVVTIRDPVVGAHAPRDYSTDLLAAVIPGGHWRFGATTQPYWSRLPGNIEESSVHVGVSVLALVGLAWRRRSSAPRPELPAWFLVGAVFWVLSLGPVLHVWGREVGPAIWPYAWLEWLLPPLRVSGVPVRMMVMTQLAAAVLAGFAWGTLARGPRVHRALAGIAAVAIAVEYLPAPLAATRVATPAYVEALRALPAAGGVVDAVDDPYRALLFQTIHGKPLAFGYVSRLPASVAAEDRKLRLQLERGQLQTICRDYRIRYLLLRERGGPVEAIVGGHTAFRDGSARLVVLDCPP